MRAWRPAAVLGLALMVAGCSSGGPDGPARTPSVPTTRPTLGLPTLAPTPRPTDAPLPTEEPTPTPDPRLPLPGSTFTGVTSQGTTFLLAVPRPGVVGYPTLFKLKWRCDDGTRSTTEFSYGPGGFDAIDDAAFTLFPGLGAEASVSGIRGRFSAPDKVEGTGRIVQVFTPIGGSEQRCDSGSFTFESSKVVVKPPPVVSGPLEPMLLQEAIAAGYVDVHFAGFGSSGDAVEATVSSRVEVELELELEDGSRLASKNPSIQDMVVRRLKGEISAPGSGSYRPTLKMSLDPYEAITYLIEAYCLDFDEGNPTADSGFTVKGLAPSSVRAVLRAADELEPAPSVRGIQAAVWSLTDNVTRSGLRARFPVSNNDLAVARKLLEAAGIDPESRRLFQ